MSNNLKTCFEKATSVIVELSNQQGCHQLKMMVGDVICNGGGMLYGQKLNWDSFDSFLTSSYLAQEALLLELLNEAAAKPTHLLHGASMVMTRIKCLQEIQSLNGHGADILMHAGNRIRYILTNMLASEYFIYSDIALPIFNCPEGRDISAVSEQVKQEYCIRLVDKLLESIGATREDVKTSSTQLWVLGMWDVHPFGALANPDYPHQISLTTLADEPNNVSSVGTETVPMQATA